MARCCNGGKIVFYGSKMMRNLIFLSDSFLQSIELFKIQPLPPWFRLKRQASILMQNETHMY